MFITFEGPEGSGKSTVMQAVAARLERPLMQHVSLEVFGSARRSETCCFLMITAWMHVQKPYCLLPAAVSI